MAQAPTILKADRGRANAAALGVLCLLATAQSALVMNAIWQRSDAVGTSPKTTTATLNLLETQVPRVLPTVSFSPPPVGQLAVVPPVEATQPSLAPSQSPPPIGSFAAPVAPLTQPTPAPVPTVPTQVAKASPPSATPPPSVPKPNLPPSSDPAANMSLEEMIELAKQVRGIGDMQGALEVLKRADLQFPARPEVLAETAQCYETMGLTDKAAALWRQLESMDPARAAGFRDLAQRRLNSPSTPTSTASSALAGSESAKILSLGACLAQKDASVTNGEKVVLRIPILRQGNTQVDPSQVDIDVYFFDRVNGEKIAQTIADEPVSAWAAAPVDWSGIGEEPLDVTYFLPALTPGEIAAHGRRSYHGYVVRLYYQHKLQDVAAEPRDLLDFGSRSPQTVPGGVNPLLPPLTN